MRFRYGLGLVNIVKHLKEGTSLTLGLMIEILHDGQKTPNPHGRYPAGSRRVSSLMNDSQLWTWDNLDKFQESIAERHRVKRQRQTSRETEKAYSDWRKYIQVNCISIEIRLH